MTRLLLVAAALVILVLAGTAAAAMPPVPYFSQCDSRWGSDKLGGDGQTICSQGCALTSAAMVMAYYGVDTDPKRLNNAIGRAGYDENYWIYWPTVRNVCHDETNQIEYSPGTVKPFDTTVLNTHLDAGHPVIVNVGGHFVVVTGRSDGTYYINDPISSAKSTLDAYPNREGMHIYSGNPPDINKPLVGDWNGNGTDTTGIYNYTTANFSLDSGLNISFGISGDIPITGDWNGNGYDTIGVFRPSTAQFFLDYDNDGVSDMNATFGIIGDAPVAGDWDGDGDDNIGVFRPNHSESGLTMFFLDLDNSGGSADQSVAFGEPDDLPVIGDWDGDGDDNIGLYRPGSTTGVFYLDIDNDGGSADIVTPEYGDLGDIPIAGDWDGDSDDNIGVYRPETGEFFMDASMPSVPKTIYVDDDFSDDPAGHKWDTIQEGVDDAADGDTVIVYAGVYVENVDVSKQISLIGEGAHDLDDGLGTEQLGVKEKGTSIDLDEGGNTMIIDDVGFMTSDDGGDQCGLFIRRTVGYLSLDIEFPDPMVVNKEITITVTSDGFPIEGAAVKLAGENLGLTDSDGKVRVTVEDAGMFTITATKEGYESASEDIRILTDDVVTVWAADVSDHVFEVTADWVNIAGFNVTGTTGYRAAGIYLNHTNRCTIYGNNASNNTYGICLEDSSNNTLTSNTVNSNYKGIDLTYSSNNTLQSNTASDNDDDGIYLYYSSNNTLQSNTANSHRCGGGECWDCGIYLRYSGNNTLQSNNCSNNDCGISLSWYSNCNTLQGNTASNNSCGIYLPSSCNNTLQSNTASNNSVGISLKDSSNNTLMKNTASNNGNGIFLYTSNNNTLCHNNLINNTLYNAYDDSANTWDSGSAGNYYSNYNGTDNNTDGIGDTHHPIPGGTSIDHFPLMHPWTAAPQKGDLNGDDQITPADAAIALRLAATGAHDPAADMSGDGKVTSLDALMILQAAVDSTTRKENQSAVIETSMGTMTAELYGQRAPNTTANFIELAESGFYDGLIFHRVIDDFVIQGGCPNGDGTGGSGKAIELEIHPDLTHVDGAIAMARSQDPDSASSQFYICDGAQHMLNGQYAVFGRVIDGINVVRAIAEVATDSRDKPIEDVVIIKISIIDRE